MANTITFFRIAASIVLLFCPVFSPAFYVFYIAAGLSDMLDGFVARKTDTVSKLGARLDTIADFVLVGVCLIKLLPVLRIPAWLYIWIGIIALIKVVNIISGFAVQKTFMAVHSTMNKATGLLLFLLPLTIPVFPLKYSAIVACAVATFAAIQEGHLIRTEVPGKRKRNTGSVLRRESAVAGLRMRDLGADQRGNREMIIETKRLIKRRHGCNE
mgnify:CR=1 FL=1